ncbi:NAD(P)/FAD-dependent oxidoreductase [Lacisediminihabitans profunda]|uniref:NAD(P)/FAD-dependent oxidoreductase n=1 Tax=Lacisediminihabitans profunda TaxID=2594790 RepID=A0A5C8ULX3_9MICO|nr:NAD(P)/FAD-dependent oxidoreductase [Lacisediminihabitans profunda]TXN29342.1 NAD(P)/FAD-dependent oxidoreductase [Lacisediminihabitans profunda]
MTEDFDVTVVGAGPVGLAAAIEARMLGLTVAVIEPRAPAIDKACGEGLMPGALPALARLGVDPAGHPLSGVSYRSGTTRVDHLFGGAGGRGVRRTILHSALSARAAELGVLVVSGRVDSLEQDDTGVTAGGIRSRYLLGADGLHSTVRRLTRLERPVAQKTRRFGLRRHYSMAPEGDLIEVYWTKTVEAYVTPVGDDLVGIAMLGPQGTNFERALAEIPELAARVAGRRPASDLRGAGPFRQRTTARSLGRVMLVGDASGYVDAITGEGIRVGLAQARAAIDCVDADDPGRYEREWSRRTRDFRLLTAGLVAAANSPLRAGIVPTAAALPGLFGAVVDRLAR